MSSYFPSWRRTAALLLGLAVVSTLTGCATPNRSNDLNWGSETTLLPGWDRIKRAAVNAASEPQTWAPLLGAAAFSVGDLDQETVDWATDHNPLFGSDSGASDASDVLAQLSNLNYGATVLMTPSDGSQDAAIAKGKALSVGLAAYAANSHITSQIKSATGRDRPYGNDGGSFPSRHTSGATTTAAMAAQNIQHMDLSEQQKKIWTISSYSLAGLTGWARVEAGAHHPSDVLAGFALGNFLGSFFTQAFVAEEHQDQIGLTVQQGNYDEWILGVQWRW